MKAPQRTGAVPRANADITRRLSRVRALWLAVHNDPNITVKDTALEFYYAVGELLEGRTTEGLELRKIDPVRVAAHLQDYKET